jgi:hypothetical protein
MKDRKQSSFIFNDFSGSFRQNSLSQVIGHRAGRASPRASTAWTSVTTPAACNSGQRGKECARTLQFTRGTLRLCLGDPSDGGDAPLVIRRFGTGRPLPAREDLHEDRSLRPAGLRVGCRTRDGSLTGVAANQFARKEREIGVTMSSSEPVRGGRIGRSLWGNTARARLGRIWGEVVFSAVGWGTQSLYH